MYEFSDALEGTDNMPIVINCMNYINKIVKIAKGIIRLNIK